jgi:uncharacterized protein YaaW (UPF0174 family)
MPKTDAFATLSSPSLLDACDLLSFDPATSPWRHLSELTLTERLRWADANRKGIEAEFCSAGSWSFSKTRSYTEVVFALAEKIGASRDGTSIADIEDAIVRKVWKDTTDKMSAEEREELNRKAQETAAKYGRSAKSEAAGFAALGAAQLSGFGIYMAGSTILGAVNSALGLGLGFGAFTGLSSLISTAIGPLGWAALGIFTVAKLGAPNWKKVLPVVVLIASQRAIAQTDFSPVANAPTKAPATEDFTASNTEQSEIELVLSEDTRSAVSTASARQEPPSPGNGTRQKAQAVQEQRSPSRMDRIVFRQSPANRPLIKFAADLGCHDFLAVDLETQAAIRELFEEEKASTRPAVEVVKQEVPRVSTASNGAAAPKKHTAIKRKAKELSTLLPNVELAEKAVERLLGYERDNILYTSFLQQLRLMNDGLRSDKHHVRAPLPRYFREMREMVAESITGESALHQSASNFWETRPLRTATTNTCRTTKTINVTGTAHNHGQWRE